jgi:hypothetical protein
VRLLSLHPPSSRRLPAATVISLLALFFALGGTAIAATGGTFILGKSNTATRVTSLSNTKGTALKLSSTASTAPLTVSNSVRIPDLNASELDGHHSSAFLSAGGTAANARKLGGTPASGYMQGGGDTTGNRITLTGRTGPTTLLSSPGANLVVDCDFNGTGTELLIYANGDQDPGASITWWNKDGVADDPQFGLFGTEGDILTPGGGSTSPYVVVVQMDDTTSVSTFTVSDWYDSGSDTCHFTGQIVTTNG